MPINLISQTELASFVKQNPFKEDKLFSDINVHFNYGFMLGEAVLYNTPGCSIRIYPGNHMTTTEHSYPIPLKYGLADANNTQASGHLFVPTYTVSSAEIIISRRYPELIHLGTATFLSRAGGNSRQLSTSREQQQGARTHQKDARKWRANIP